MSRLPYLVVGLLLSAWLITPTMVTGQTIFEVQPGSSFKIKGTSTVNSFTCTAEEVQGNGRVMLGSERVLNVSSRSGNPVQVEVSIPVRDFDCGNGRMNSDMYEALKADRHPEIAFELVDVRLLQEPKMKAGPYRFNVKGLLTIGGEAREIETTVEGQELAVGVYRITGNKSLLMTDFGITPPTALLGLVKAHDRIEVQYDLIAACRELVAEAKRKGFDGWRDYTRSEGQPYCSNDHLYETR